MLQHVDTPIAVRADATAAFNVIFDPRLYLFALVSRLACISTIDEASDLCCREKKSKSATWEGATGAVEARTVEPRHYCTKWPLCFLYHIFLRLWHTVHDQGCRLAVRTTPRSHPALRRQSVRPTSTSGYFEHAITLSPPFLQPLFHISARPSTLASSNGWRSPCRARTRHLQPGTTSSLSSRDNPRLRYDDRVLFLTWGY